MRALVGLLVIVVSGLAFAEAGEPMFGERSLFSDRNIKERLRPDGEVCLKGEACAGQKPGEAIVAAGDEGPKTPDGVYNTNCAACHTSGIAGAPKLGDAAAWQARLGKGLDAVVDAAYNGVGGMPAKGMCNSCTKDDIKAVVQYILDESNVSSGSSNGSQNSADATGVESAPEKTTEGSSEEAGSGQAVVQADSQSVQVEANGEEVYSLRCSVCHGQGIAGAPKVGDKGEWDARLANGLAAVTENAIKGVGSMPPKGACASCTDQEIELAVKYMVEQSQ